MGMVGYLARKLRSESNKGQGMYEPEVETSIRLAGVETQDRGEDKFNRSFERKVSRLPTAAAIPKRSLVKRSAYGALHIYITRRDR